MCCNFAFPVWCMRQAVKHANLKELRFAAIISVRQKQNVWPVYKVVW